VKVRLGFLMSQTGGGHVAAASAIKAGLDIRYPGLFACEQVDVLRELAPPPWNRVPEVFPYWIRYGSLSFNAFASLSNRVLAHPFGRDSGPAMAMWRGHRKLARRYDWDGMVVVFPSACAVAVGARRMLSRPTPIVTVITDLAKPHSGWYHPQADKCLVPNEPAFERGLCLGLRREQMSVVGHPVHPKFVLYKGTKTEAREQLGWRQDLTSVLLTAGGMGVGNLFRLAQAVADLDVPLQLAVVSGTNARLRHALQRVSWPCPTFVYGFVDNLEVLMRAADLLVGKPGPGTIAEAAVSGLPMILSGALMHERANVELVRQAQAGVFVESPTRVGATVQHWIEGGAGLLGRLSANARRLAAPEACWRIADEIASLYGIEGAAVVPHAVGASPWNARTLG